MDDSQQHFWNAWNAQNRENVLPNAWSQARGDWVIDQLRCLNLPGQAKILEIGCASGWLSQQLIPFGDITATDLADEVVNRAQERLPEIHFRSGPFETLQFGTNKFDVVVCLETLAHVPDQKLFVERAANVVHPGGQLLLTIQNEFVWRRTHLTSDFDDTPIHKWLTMNSLKKLLKPHFEIREASSILPSGHAGVLRLTNSYFLNRVLQTFISPKTLDGIKGRLMLGNTLVVAAVRR